MKRIKFIGCLVLALFAATMLRAEYSDAARQALQQAAADAQQSLRSAGLPAENVSLLPIGGDQGNYVEGLLKNAVTAAGLSYVEGGQDPLWNAILAEIEWDERKGDMLDAATLVKFGKLKGTQLLMYGNVRAVSESASRVFVELELHLTSVSTKQHLWGGVFAKRFYLPGKVQGIVKLDDKVRKVIKTAFEGAADSVKNSGKIRDISSVAVVPLAGDVDGYVKSLVVDMLSETQLNPRELDVLSLAEARVILRDQPKQADAVLFGAVRDLSRELKHDEAFKDIYEIHTEVQLTLQSAKTGDVLWSKTLGADALDEETITPKEAAWYIFKNHPKAYLMVGGAILGLIVLAMFMKAATRSR